jgi:hypothetical protein
MSEQLYKVTEFFGITMAVFTCSRDNAKSNDCLLHDFEKKVQEQYENLDDHEQAQYYLWFSSHENDVNEEDFAITRGRLRFKKRTETSKDLGTVKRWSNAFLHYVAIVAEFKRYNSKGEGPARQGRTGYRRPS